MKGYKAFNQNLMCRDMQYKIGKEYTFDGEPIPCQQGFHFCKSIADCYSFYSMSDDTRICEITASGDITTDDEVKYCTNKIKIVREVKNPRIKSNLSDSSSGYCNSGNCNSGDWNSGDWNSGIFNTDKVSKIKIFDTESDWTMNDWFNSKACTVMAQCPYTHSEFICDETMSDEEKENHPEYKTIGGYIKTIVVADNDKQEWWNALSSDERQAVYNLPNFDAEKFRMCTGITVKAESEDKT